VNAYGVIISADLGNSSKYSNEIHDIIFNANIVLNFMSVKL